MALQPWIRIGQPLEPVMNDYERIFDAWEAGGIKALFSVAHFLRIHKVNLPFLPFLPIPKRIAIAGWSQMAAIQRPIPPKRSCSMPCSITPKRVAGKFLFLLPAAGGQRVRNHFH